MQDNPQSTSPFAETTVAKNMLSRMEITHEERGISVISGPWGIGKTTAINAFAEKYECQCAIVKIDAPTGNQGTSLVRVMQLVIEALEGASDYVTPSRNGRSAWILRHRVNDLLARHFDLDAWSEGPAPPFTFIFDEAQSLSKEAIEALRFWNDADRPVTPFPVALIFVGNDEFALEERGRVESVLSGAVRSRLMFRMKLSYDNLPNSDLSLIVQSRGIEDPDAIAEFVKFFDRPRMKRDMRTGDRILRFARRIKPDGPIDAEAMRAAISFAADEG